MTAEFFQNFDKNTSGKLQWETLVENTSDDLRILQEFQSELWLEIQLTAEFQLILNGLKSADCIFNYEVNCQLFKVHN